MPRSGAVLFASVLFLGGCVVPGAQVTPGAVDLVGAATLEGGTVSVLPSGDLRLSVAGETDAFEEYKLVLPPGATYVTATVRADSPFGVIMLDEESGMIMCWPQRHSSFLKRIEGEMRCTALAPQNEGRAWTVRAVNGLPLDEITGTRESAPFDLEITVSAAPLDGPAGMLKLDALSDATLDPAQMTSTKVPASTDGALLNVEITLPDAPGPFPTILVSSPYNTPPRAATGRANAPFADLYAARGYAVVVMDLRGTGTSGGCFAMRDPVDGQDIADVIDWIAGEEWSDGNVGMWGLSYVGFTTVAGAVKAPPALKAIVAGAPAVNAWGNFLPGGVPTGESVSFISGYLQGSADTTEDPSNPIGAMQYRADAFCEPANFPMANDPRYLHSDWYESRNITSQSGDIKAAVMLQQGFWDLNVKANHVPDWFNAIEAPKKGIFGSWEHVFALRADEPLMTLAWFDEWLKGRDTGIMDTPTVEVLTNTREYRAATAWPPLDATDTLVPFGKGQAMYAGAPLRSIGAALPDAITIESEPFVDGLYISGVPHVAFTASLQLGGTSYFQAKLFEIDAAGDSILVSEGWLNAAHTEAHRAYEPLAPGASRAMDLQLLPIDHVVKPGSRLALELRSIPVGEHPTGGPAGGAGPANLVTVELDASMLVLPTLPKDLLLPQPRSVS